MSKSRGLARVGYLAVEARVKELHAQGYPAKYIYDLFVEEGKIEMTYRYFCKLLNKSIEKPSLLTPVAQPSPQPTIPNSPSHTPKKFHEQSTIDDDELGSRFVDE